MPGVQVVARSCAFSLKCFLGVHDLSLRTPGDQLEKDRGKFIHTVGAVGKVEWRTSGVHPYTGVFKVSQGSTLFWGFMES